MLAWGREIERLDFNPLSSHPVHAMMRCAATALARPTRAAALLRSALNPTSRPPVARRWGAVAFMSTKDGANACAPIVWTITDEAPALATASFLPVVQAFSAKAGIQVDTRDISLSRTCAHPSMQLCSCSASVVCAIPSTPPSVSSHVGNERKVYHPFLWTVLYPSLSFY